MLKDQFNNTVYTSDHEIIFLLNQFENNFLGYKKNTKKIFSLAKKYDGFILFQLHATLICIFMDTAKGFNDANIYIDKCKKLIHNQPVTDREVYYFNFLNELLIKNFFESLDYLDKLINKNTKDLFFAKLGQIFYFSIGNNKKMKDLAELAIKDNKKNPYALSMLSFALEESNQIEKAKKYASKAIDIDPSDPWAHHTFAHIFEVKNIPDEGISFLENLSSYWNDCNSFIYTHNWWHIALLYLRIKDIDTVFNIFDKHLWNSPNSDNSYSQDQAGAISLLIRLRVNNINVEKQWEEVLSSILKRDVFFSDPFISTHFAYAISLLSNKSVKIKFLQDLDSLNHSKNEYDIKIWKNAGVSLCNAMMKHAEKDYQSSCKYFNKSKNFWHLVGGSHTQRDLFKILFNDAKNKIKI